MSDELASDRRDQWIARSLGERDDFLLGGRDRQPMIQLQAEQALFPGFENLFQTPGCLDAQRAFEQ